MIKAMLRGTGLLISAVFLLFLSALAFKFVFTTPLRSAIDVSFLTTEPGTILTYASASFALLLGFYFLTRFWLMMTERQRFVRDGAQGPIEVSPLAIEDFVKQLVIEDPHLHNARVQLKHAPGGALNVILNVALDYDAAVVQTSERLQQRLKDRIEGHLGIEVHQVTVYTERLDKGTSKPATTPTMPQLEHKQMAPEAETSEFEQGDKDDEY
jgi:uncharacterized alkaline shock family protein YloU